MTQLGLRAALAAGVVALGLFWCSGPAHAYCLTTTCDPEVPCFEDSERCCVYDANLCDINGRVVNWHQSCVTYNWHESGSARLGITGQQLSDVLDQAFAQWMDADCPQGSKSISVEGRGPASCGEPQFNEGPKEPNANVWMFQDDPDRTNNLGTDGFVIDASSLAVSVITFDYLNAELLNVDVEFNSAAADFAVDAPKGSQIDLLAVATHEAGHFLGLEHSVINSATMFAYYHYHQRTLTWDDELAICAAYPTDREIEKNSCEPFGGYSPDCVEPKGCGCRVAGLDRAAGLRQGSSGGSWAWWSWAAVAALIARRRQTVLRRQAHGA